MAKKIKGEVALKYEGKSYTLLLDFNALAEFEDAAAVPNALETLNQGMGAKLTRILFWCGLKGNHPDITLEEAGRILTDNADKLAEALSASFPGSKDGGEGNGPKAP